MKIDVHQGEIYLTRIGFTDGTGNKIRPVIVVSRDDSTEIDIIMVTVSSQKPRGPFDIVIEYWKESGLLVSSIARTNKITTASRERLGRKLGSLVMHDLNRVLDSCRNLF